LPKADVRIIVAEARNNPEGERRDVGLDSDRCAGGGPAGRPDQEGVHQVLITRPAMAICP
jgi:hypothetical protein